MSLEPTKFEVGEGGGLRLTEEWKKWRNTRLNANTIRGKKTKKKAETVEKKRVTAENHVERWKVIAWAHGGGKQILFCCCMANTGESYRSCGAVATQNVRGGKLTVLLEPRFE
jgi:hypothetical protein